jgi:hypothetical protein
MPQMEQPQSQPYLQWAMPIQAHLFHNCDHFRHRSKMNPLVNLPLPMTMKWQKSPSLALELNFNTISFFTAVTDTRYKTPQPYANTLSFGLTGPRGVSKKTTNLSQ